MKRVTILMLVFFAIGKLNAQDYLFGLYYNGSQFVLSSMDLATGDFNDISSLTGVTSLSGLDKGFDADNGFYIRTTNLGITIIDVQTGNIVNTFSNTKNVSGLSYDPVTSKIYGTYYSSGTNILTSMDISTGIFSDIGVLTGVTSVYAGENTFDSTDGYYIRRTNLGITVIDVQNANIVDAFPATVSISGIIYDPVTSKLYGTYYSSGTHIFTSMNMTTGAFSDIAALAGVSTLTGGSKSFDPNGYYLRGSDLGILKIDIQTGSFTNFSNTPNMGGIEFYNTGALSLIDESLDSNVILYPIPVKDELNIKLKNLSSPMEIRIYSSTGMEVYSKELNASKNIVVNIGRFNSGIYFLKITNNEVDSTFKVVKD